MWIRIWCVLTALLFYLLIAILSVQENIFVYVGRQNECHVFSFAEDGYVTYVMHFGFRQNNNSFQNFLPKSCAFFLFSIIYMLSLLPIVSLIIILPYLNQAEKAVKN